MNRKCARCGDPMTIYYALQRRCDPCELEIALIEAKDARRREPRFAVAKDTTGLASPL